MNFLSRISVGVYAFFILNQVNLNAPPCAAHIMWIIESERTNRMNNNDEINSRPCNSLLVTSIYSSLCPINRNRICSHEIFKVVKWWEEHSKKNVVSIFTSTHLDAFQLIIIINHNNAHTYTSIGTIVSRLKFNWQCVSLWRREKHEGKEKQRIIQRKFRWTGKIIYKWYNWTKRFRLKSTFFSGSLHFAVRWKCLTIEIEWFDGKRCMKIAWHIFLCCENVFIIGKWREKLPDDGSHWEGESNDYEGKSDN